nr:MAG TPA: SGNH-hydrolase family esterase, SGNH-hydrolase family, marine, HYDROLASE [Caudoviricetes sp.]
MDISPDPVKVYFIGDSGEVSVDVVEHIVSQPLASGGSRARDITHTVSNISADHHEITVYR